MGRMAYETAILAVGAHPDDIEIGCGGTLARCVENGYKVHAIVLTKGELGGKGRSAETKEALRVLGVENVEVWSYPDGNLKGTKKLVERIYEKVRQWNIGWVFAHYFDDAHQDHVVASYVVTHACRKVKALLYYETPTTGATFVPQLWVDVKKYARRKVKALQAHKTQLHQPYIQRAIERLKFRGSQVGLEYAEAFVVKHFIV